MMRLKHLKQTKQKTAYWNGTDYQQLTKSLTRRRRTAANPQPIRHIIAGAYSHHTPQKTAVARLNSPQKQINSRKTVQNLPPYVYHTV